MWWWGKSNEAEDEAAEEGRLDFLVAGELSEEEMRRSVSSSDQRSWLFRFLPRLAAMKSEIIAPPHILLYFLALSFLCVFPCRGYGVMALGVVVSDRGERIIEREREGQRVGVLCIYAGGWMAGRARAGGSQDT